MDKRLNYLGIARRAGYLISGTDAVISSIQSVKTTKAKLVLVASDASAGTKEKIINKCYFYKVECLDIFSTIELSEAIGLENPKVIAITDKGIANQIKKTDKKEVDLDEGKGISRNSKGRY